MISPAVVLALGVLIGSLVNSRAFETREDAFHVHPGESIQEALEAAARSPSLKLVRVHEGTYRPENKRQALIWFNRRHEGVQLEAVGQVVLTAANPDLADPQQESYPAIVNHIVYFGDGISAKTRIRGFRLTGANGFMSMSRTRQLEPDQKIPKGWFFYSDGGAVKVFGRSYPVLEQLIIEDNYTSPCGAGISVQHEGHQGKGVLIQDCIFRGNRTRVTGAAIDLLPGSAAKIINCLFAGNVSNLGSDVVAEKSGEKPFVNSGVLTIFHDSWALVQNCTFTGNRNAVDDMGGKSRYVRCLFWKNELNEGLPDTSRYELDLQKGGEVTGCFIHGRVMDPRRVLNGSDSNTLDAPDPRFDGQFVPTHPDYQGIGYLPKSGD